MSSLPGVESRPHPKFKSGEREKRLFDKHSRSRREFLRGLAGAAAAGLLAQACRALGVQPIASSAKRSATPSIPLTESATPSASPLPTPSATPIPSPTPASMIGRVALVETEDRAEGVRRALELLGLNPVQGKQVLIKPNYNTADPAPASTHPDVLRSLVEWLRDSSAGSISIGDRSGMAVTRQAMQTAQAFSIARQYGLSTVVFDELEAGGWVRQMPPESHWRQGFYFARPALEAEAVVLACCLKTHRFGGHFSLSLKDAVGMVAKAVPGDGHNYMTELHNSPNQRSMIAEVNTAYTPALIVIDGVDAFVQGGPEAGTKVHSKVVLAGADRVALDAVGVALLRYYGTTAEVSGGPVFGQEQIARAIELGLGVNSPRGIQFITGDAQSEDYATALRPILDT